MNIFGFHSVVKSEKRAQKYLRKYWRKNGRVFCPACGSPKVYQITGQRYRCRRCKNRFSELSGTWIRKLKISSAQWLWIIKLFELEMSARKISQQLDLSYPTVLKATNLIRQSIVANSKDWNWLQGEVEADDAYFGGKRKGKRGRGARNKIPVFGILERNGQVKVEVVERLTAETICGLTVKTVRRGSIVYTDKYHGYDSLMFCGYRHLNIDHSKRFACGKVYINGVEGFWSYAKERLIKFHGVSKDKFPYYLKEMEFRYNNRHRSIFDKLVKYASKPVPNHL